jgi:HlyD family secretion protein
MKSASILTLPENNKKPTSSPPPERSTRLPTAAISLKAYLTSLALVVWEWKWAGLAIAAALLLAVYFGPNAIFGPRASVDLAIRGTFLQTVVASGHVEAPFRVNIGSQITAVVAKVPVVEGQSVKAGDTLIELEDSELHAAASQNEAAVAQGEAHMRQIRELTLPAAQQSLKQAQATLTNALRVYDRTAKLNKDGYSTMVVLDDATRALDIAKAQLKSAEFQVATNQTGGSDYAMAETQLSQAQANLDSAQSRLSYTVIKAPRDGILISRSVEIGTIVSPQAVLMVLSPDGAIQIVVQIDEKNLGLISVGQEALVSADAYPNERFPAQVAYINPGIDLQRAAVEVKLRVPIPPNYLRQDMTVSVDIGVARRENAVILPAGSIRDSTSSNPWVLKEQSGCVEKQPVKVGIVSGGKAEILAGVEAGDRTIPASNTAIKVGQRVRALLPVAEVQ